MDMKRFFLYAIAIAALALAGCGGNGGGAPPDPGDMPEMPDLGMMPETPSPMDVAATAAAATKLTAINDENDTSAAIDAGLGGSQSDGTPIIAPYTVAFTRDRTETKVTIADTADGFTDVDEDPQFSTVPATDAPAFLAEQNGFTGTMNVRVNSDDEDGLVEEVVVVRTDIDLPTATEFGMVTDQGLTVRKDAMMVNADNPADSLDINDDAKAAMMMATMFSAPSGAGSVNFTGDNPATAGMDEAAEVMGSYNGALGTYRCTGGTGGCTVTLVDGKVTTSNNTWIFTPGEDETSDVLDTDYLAYGIWLKKTTKDGETTYNEVEAFTAGNVAQTASITDVEGTATYTGNSTGVYVKNVYAPSTSGEQEIVSATSGLYSALVNLRANFGGGDVAANKQFRIEGDVTNFVLEKEATNDWEVKLESATFPNAVVFNGETTGDSTADKGAWNGAFYGATPLTEAAAADNANATVAPDHVLGELNAFFTDGAVLGGFGANKD